MAIFNAKSRTASAEIDVSKIVGNTVHDLYKELFNDGVRPGEDRYFRIGNYRGPLSTISVTSGCIVVVAFTQNQDGSVKSSGVYHASHGIWETYFSNKMLRLSESIQPYNDEKVIVKTVGWTDEGMLPGQLSSTDEEKLSELLSDARARVGKNLKYNLERVGLSIDDKNLIIGGRPYRHTEFHPLRGQLVTYFLDSNERTVI